MMVYAINLILKLLSRKRELQTGNGVILKKQKKFRFKVEVICLRTLLSFFIQVPEI